MTNRRQGGGASFRIRLTNVRLILVRPMLPPSILDKSLQELEHADWGEPTYDSHLVTTIHRLRRVPLRQFSVEDLRIMIGQNIGLQYLVPLALEHLRYDPLAQGDFYPGDLLKMVLSADARFWQNHPEWRKEVEEIAQRATA
jgi:hypothetical protein